MKQKIKYIFLILLSFINLSYADQSIQDRKKIISIGAGVTELVVALGMEKQLIATDSTSRRFVEQYHIPSVGYQRNLNTEGILSLQPDLLIGSEEMGPKDVIQQLKQAGISIVELQNNKNDVYDLLTHIMQIGEVLQKRQEAENLVSNVKQRIEKIAKKNLTSMTALFLFLPDNRQVMAGGHHTSIDGMIQLLKLKNIATEKEGYYAYSIESALKAQPEVVLVAQRGLQQNLEHLFKDYPFLTQFQAVKNHCIFTVDGQALLGGFNLTSLAESERIADQLKQNPQCHAL